MRKRKGNAAKAEYGDLTSRKEGKTPSNAVYRDANIKKKEMARYIR